MLYVVSARSDTCTLVMEFGLRRDPVLYGVNPHPRGSKLHVPLPTQAARSAFISERDGARETCPSPSDFSGFLAPLLGSERRDERDAAATREGIRGAARRASSSCSYPSGFSRRRASNRCTGGWSPGGLGACLLLQPIFLAREAYRVHVHLGSWMDGAVAACAARAGPASSRKPRRTCRGAAFSWPGCELPVSLSSF
jgi:hypothetical protein